MSPPATAQKKDETVHEERTETNIRDIFAMFERGEIDANQALELLEKARKSRHGLFERYMSF